jgi:hypothetical protein
LPQLETIATGTKAIMSESQFEAGRVKFDQHLGPCVGDWYEMNDGCRRRFGRDLGESLQLAADPSGRYISFGADGNATYNGPLLDRIIQKSSLGKPLEQRRRGSFNNVQSTNCRVFKER